MLKSLIALISFMLVIFTSENVNCQTFEMNKDSSSVLITGTSNLHDWKMGLRNFDCSVSFQMQSPVVAGIDKAVFNASSTDLKSDNSMMDRKAYAALKSKTNPEIKFVLTQPVKIASSGPRFETDVTGNLEIAGKSNVLTVPVTGVVNTINGTERIDIKGSAIISMGNYDISPPTFMMGALKTADKVTVAFSLQFIIKKS